MADQQKLISALYLMAWLCDDVDNLMDPILPADLGIVVTWHLCHHHPPGSLWQTWPVNHGILLCWALMWPQSPCEESSAPDSGQHNRVTVPASQKALQCGRVGKAGGKKERLHLWLWTEHILSLRALCSCIRNEMAGSFSVFLLSIESSLAYGFVVPVLRGFR